MRIGLSAVGMLAVVVALNAQDELDLGVINRIKSEALVRSQVMDHAFFLTDVHGLNWLSVALVVQHER